MIDQHSDASHGADPDCAETTGFAADRTDPCDSGQDYTAPESTHQESTGQETVETDPRRPARRPVRRRAAVGGEVGGDVGAEAIDRDITRLARDQAEAAIRTLATIMKSRKGAPTARIAAANALLTRGFGRSQSGTEAKEARQAGDLSDDELARIARGTDGESDRQPPEESS